MKLVGKIIIKGGIRTLTGLHIGGSKSAYEVGGVDLNVVKDAAGRPYIPGSSLKGKLRSMLGKKEGSTLPENDLDYIKEIFGAFKVVTRLYVRDALLDVASFKSEYPDATKYQENEFSGIKWENMVNRQTGLAADKALRQLERVPEKCVFDYEIIYNLHDDTQTGTKLKEHLDAIYLAMKLLQDDYLGGQGSRGYGKIAFKDSSITVRSIENNQYLEKIPTTMQVTIQNFETQIKSLSA